MTLVKSLLSDLPADRLVDWVEYRPVHNVVARFGDDWKLIDPQTESEQELQNLMAELPNSLAVTVMTDRRSGDALGILMFYLTGKHRLSVHGGGWDFRGRGPMLYLCGLRLLMDSILAKGYHVVSSSRDNPRAVRFMQAVGFRVYSYRYGRTHYYISRRTLAAASLKRPCHK